jgi:hypothetical protein
MEITITFTEQEVSNIADGLTYAANQYPYLQQTKSDWDNIVNILKKAKNN